MRRGRVIAIALSAAALTVVLAAGEVLSRPTPVRVGSPPPALGARELSLATDAGGSVSGWYVPGEPGAGAILLLHGIRGDRRQMTGRARFLRRAGYSVLLIDLPAHGQSSGSRITFGLREAAGVRTALRYLHEQHPAERTAVLGVSLGAAAFVFAGAAPAPGAVVLESMYPTIEDAVANRLSMRFGRAGAGATPLLLWQLPVWAGVSARDLRPIAALERVRAPLLLVSGTHDRHTTWAETKRLFAVANEPKELWAIDGAAHVDLHAFDPAPYEARVLSFLARHLR